MRGSIVQIWILETLFHKRFQAFYLFKLVKEKLWRLYINLFRKQFSELVPGHMSNRNRAQMKSGCFIIGAVFQQSWWGFWAISTSKSRLQLFHTAKCALVQALIVSKCRKGDS